MNRLIVIVLTAAILSSGCATVFNDKNRTIAVNSQTPGSEVSIDGAPVGVTPMVIGLTSRENLANSQALFEARGGGMPWAAFDSVILVKAANGQQTICDINKHIGVVWIVLDVLFGLLPLIFDAITGQWVETNPTCNAL